MSIGREQFDLETGEVLLMPIARRRWYRQSLPTKLSGDSLTKQEFRDECDIHTIMKKYEKTGLVDHASRFRGRYGDFLDAPTFQESIDAVRKAEEMFMSLPSRIRGEFENDPAKFLEFAQDEANFDKLREMGLAKPVSRREATLDDVVDAVKASSGSGSGSA